MKRIWFVARRRSLLTIAGSLVAAAVIAGCNLGAPRPAAGEVTLPSYAPQSDVPTATVVAPAATSAAVSPTAESVSAAENAPLRTVGLAAPVAGGTLYGAEIVADHQVVVAAQVNGQVTDVTVDIGDVVKAGDVLVRIDSSALEAQAAQAKAGLEAAASNLSLLQDPAKAQDLAAAQAAVNAASAAYTRASNGPTDEERRMALAQLMQAQAAVGIAQAAYNVVKGNPNIGMLPQSLQLQQATLAQEAAQAQYDKLMKGATADLVAGAYAQLESARAQLQRLQDGAKPAQVAAAEAQVHAAEYALYLAQLQVSKATVKAPIDGIVSKVQTAAGSLAGPGAPLLTLLSQDVRVTIPVEEARLSQLAIGQPARISVAAYPGRAFAGAVAIVAPELDPATRTVQVTIRPTDDEGLLAPGMSATVELLAP